jgi:4-amino-4-deoxy-L-arabinose transferase-like glycosyltransferase
MFKQNNFYIDNKKLDLLFILILICYCMALFIPILRNDDSVLYANIGKNMILARSWFLLYHPFGINWLDKPHFPYWLIASVFTLFGVKSFNYVLIGMLFNFLGGYYTYKFALIMYKDKLLAKLSALILLSSFHIYFSATIDIRAEVYLIGTIIPSCYYLYKIVYLSKYTMGNLLLSSIFAAFAIMTKGVFPLITIYSILIPLIISDKFYKIILIVMIHFSLTIVFLAPEIIALYLQFNSHTGYSDFYAIKWFLWDSQLGRFFNNGVITRQNIGFEHYFFYIHTYLWAILPWTLVFIFYLKYMLQNWTKVLLQDKILFSGFGITFLLFSISKFQLDYYINILVPFSSILSAKYLLQINSNSVIIRSVTNYILSIVSILLFLLLFYITIIHNLWLVLIFILLILAITISLLILFNYFQQFVCSCIIFINAILLLIFIFYGIIYIQYEAGYNIAKYINQDNSINKIIDYQVNNLPLEFYANKNYKNIQQFSDVIIESKPYYLVIKYKDISLFAKESNEIRTYSNITMDKVLPYLLNFNQQITNDNKLFLIKVDK